MRRRFRRGIVSPQILIGTVFAAFAAIAGILFVPAISEPVADMYLEPAGKTVPVGEMFTVELMVRSTVPTNVFAAELLFDSNILAVSSIDYNTSIADLWAEKPWYENGEGTLNFAGGTTRSGGFVGNDVLLTITFETLREGEGTLEIADPHILRHDGLGTEVALPTPIDAIFTVEPEELGLENVASRSSLGSPVKVVQEPPSTDLNSDGRQTVADISIFMIHIAGDDSRYDFNLDGKVDTKDLGIIMSAE